MNTMEDHISYPAVTTATCNLAAVAALLLMGTAFRIHAQTCVAPADMTAWWKLEETSGTTAADAVGGNDGTYVGAPHFTTGKVGNALSFDGDDAVSLVSRPVAIHGNAARSIFALVRTTYHGWQAVVATGTPAYNEAFNLVVGFSGLSGNVGVMGYINDFYPSSPKRVDDGEWHFIGATYDGAGTLVTYVDGIIDNNIGGRTYNTNGQNNYIGQSNHLGGNEVPFRGDIDEVMIFDRAVTPCEVAAMCPVPVPTPTPNRAPIAIDDFYGVDELGTLNEAAPGVLVNDSDPDAGTTLTAALVTGPSHARSFQLNADGSFTYVPVISYYGPDSFTYHGYDGTLYSGSGTVNITVRQPCSTGGFITGGGKYFQDRRKCTFGFVAKMQGAVPQGNLEFQDQDLRFDVKANIVSWVYAPNLIEGYFSGACRVNNITGYSYDVQVHDHGQPGSNDDFSVWIYDSHGTQVYTSGGLLSGGNNVIHDTASGGNTNTHWWCDDDGDGAYADYGFSCTPPPGHLGCINTEPSYIDYCDTDPNATSPCD